MSNNNAKVLKSSVWYIAANFMVGASSFLTTPIFTRLLTKSQYGLFNNFTSWQSILAILFTFNVQASLISARYDYEDNLDQYILSALGLTTISVLLWTIILNLFSDWTLNFFSLSRAYLNLMLAQILFLKVFEMFQTEQRYFFKYKLQVGLSILSTISSIGLSLLLVTQMEDKLTGRVIGSVIPTILIGFVIYVNYFRKGRRIRFDYWKYTLRICLPYIPHLLSMTILGSTDRIMITRICGPTETALYSLAYSCGAMISILINSINTAFSPWLADRLHENDAKSVRGFSKYYIAAFVCVALGVMMIAPEVLQILGGESYLSAIYVMPPVTMGCVCQFLYTMFVNVEQIKRKTVGMACASVAAAVTNYVLNLLLIPRFGYIAAAYTTLAGYLLLLALHMLMVRRIGMAHVYSYRFIISAVFIVGIVMLGINALYAVSIARYIVIAVYASILALLFWWKRRWFLSIIKVLKTETRT